MTRENKTIKKNFLGKNRTETSENCLEEVITKQERPLADSETYLERFERPDALIFSSFNPQPNEVPAKLGINPSKS